MPQARARRLTAHSNECKRRKIKCNGQSPCQRCGNLNLDCAYAPNCCNNFKESESVTPSACILENMTNPGRSEFKQMSAHLSSLQQQVDDLYNNLASLRTQVDGQSHSNGSAGTSLTGENYQHTPMPPPLAAQGRAKSFGKHPRFHGPTSSVFNLGVARSSLKTMGITAAEEVEDEGVQAIDITPRASPPSPVSNPRKGPLHADKDPIWNISRHEALRLVHVWQEEQGVMYPILEIDKVLRYTEMLFSFVEAAARSGLMQGALPGADAIMDEQTSELKLILAITLVLEGQGKDALGEKLFENVHTVVEKTLSEPVCLHGINVLALAVSKSSPPFVL
jgi:hypothetical protein